MPVRDRFLQGVGLEEQVPVGLPVRPVPQRDVGATGLVVDVEAVCEAAFDDRMGTTVGMLLANIPVIMAGKWLMERLPLATARVGASLLFVILAVATVWTALTSV